MAHVRKVPRLRARGGYAWQVRYRDPDRVERSRTFPTRDQADRFARKVEVSKDGGTYLDPSLGKTLFGEWAKEWLESVEPGLKPSTLSGYRTLLRKHIDPAFGHAPLAKIRPIDVRRFVAQLSNAGMSASRLRSTYFLTQAIFRAAVDSGYIGQSPCLGVKLPRPVVREMQFLHAEQVRAVADSIPERYRALICLLAYGGLRWGEAAGLRRKRVNLL
jgi:integrase